ncbi:hypothetical protein UlMin_024493 [Ulmus minor]
MFLEKDAVILAIENELEWPYAALLPSYGKGREAPDARYISLIFGTNLTDVVITGNNGTIDGQGEHWWTNFREGKLTATRPYMIEIMYSDQIQISNITLLNSPSWNLHSIYSSDIVIEKLTILAPVNSPNTDGIDPDSCTNVRIKDCYIVSGDDCIAIKSGWDRYGIEFGMPTKDVIIEKLTCISPASAAIAFGSEMSGGIENVRAEDIITINTQTGVSVKTSPGRGGYIKNIFARRMNFYCSMTYVFRISGSYGQHPDDGFDPEALPVVETISLRGIRAENVTYPARLEGIPGNTFEGICVSNAEFILTKEPEELQWNCSNVEGLTSSVVPKACDLLPEKPGFYCPYPEDRLPIEEVPLKTC